MKTVLLFIDAFAHGYIKEDNDLLGTNLNILPLRSLIGYSSTIIPAIWGGKYPEESNIWTEFYYKPRKKYNLLHILDKLPNKYIQSITKRLCLRYLQRKNIYRETLAGVPTSIEENFSRLPIYYDKFPPIKQKNDLFDILKMNDIDFGFVYIPKLTQTNYNNIKKIINKNEVSIIYSSEIDHFGHIFGPNIQKFKDNIKNYRNLINDLCKKNNVVVFSDHGMTKVIGKIDLSQYLKKFKLGKDYLVFIDSTIARFWIKNEKVVGQFEKMLSKIQNSNLLNKFDLKRLHIQFKHQQYGEFILLANEGYLFYPDFMHGSPKIPYFDKEIQGMHGYDPKYNSTVGIVGLSKNITYDGKLVEVTDLFNLFKKIILNK